MSTDPRCTCLEGGHVSWCPVRKDPNYGTVIIGSGKGEAVSAPPVVSVRSAPLSVASSSSASTDQEDAAANAIADLNTELDMEKARATDLLAAVCNALEDWYPGFLGGFVKGSASPEMVSIPKALLDALSEAYRQDTDDNDDVWSAIEAINAFLTAAEVSGV